MYFSAAEHLDRVVERPHPLHRSEGEPLGQRTVTLVEPRDRGAERPVGVSAVLEDAKQDPERRAPRGAYLSPRSHAAYSILRPPSG